jgi:uncharacterized protein (TIGR03437 family)
LTEGATELLYVRIFYFFGRIFVSQSTLRAAIVLSAIAATGFSQTLSTNTLNGNYFVRHIEFTTDGSDNVTDARSILGTIAFNGAGNYSFSGQQVIGTGFAAPFNTSGTYAVTAAGFVTLTNPQSSTLTVNARYGTEAVIGSSTEGAGTTFDLFVAIPARAANATPPYNDQTLAVNYHMIDYELTNASSPGIRVSGMAAEFTGAGGIDTFAPLGHAASVNSGATLNTEQFTGTYTVNPDGTGTIAFAPVAGTTTASNLLLAGATRNLYVSATGNMFLGATPGAHDILIGVQNAVADKIAFSGRYWLAGLGVGSDAVISASVAPSTVVISERTNGLLPIAPGLPDLVTETVNSPWGVVTNGYGDGCGCGIGSAGNVVGAFDSFVLLGNGGTLVVVNPGVDPLGTAHPGNFQIYVGEQIPTLTGTGVWVNPQGIVSSATYAPVGDGISPGQFISIYGSGLAGQTVTATTLPFPKSLGQVSVSINGTDAPLYYVSSGLIICIVPYELTGTSATIVVTNNLTPSNSVTVAAAPFAPGILAANELGYGDGTITHLDNTLVGSASPAKVGETVQMYVVGLGALTTPVTDGNGFTGVDNAVVQPVVFINSVPAAVAYWGLTEDAGLYQIDVTIPPGTPSGEQYVAVASSGGKVGVLTQTITVAVQ